MEWFGNDTLYFSSGDSHVYVVNFQNSTKIIFDVKIFFEHAKADVMTLEVYEPKNWVKNQNHWRLSVRNHTLGIIERGLIDRAITRDIEWGVPVPLPKYENKRICEYENMRI